MRQNWNKGWIFAKEITHETIWEKVDLPHTWNGVDGQDGGNDYHRGTCFYKKVLNKSDLPEGLQTYLEFEGTNSSAELYVNGKKVMHHDGGYSLWRANITDYLQEEENEVLVVVDNLPNDYIYPQTADFTFYGGIYRNVNLISVPEAHFDLDYWGSPAILVTHEIFDNDAQARVDVYLTGTDGNEELCYEVFDGDTLIASKTTTVNERSFEFIIENVHLWHGTIDPYLYTARVTLSKNGKALDERTTRFGCRSFKIDPEKGFILNGKSYPLHGVSRHQDRPGIGNALLPKHHLEDMDLICEMGANTIRLAHYQHDSYFYDLCDERGMIVWAEIPYISKHMPKGFDNTKNQLKELIIQNYSHPSIVVWGLSNEITMGGADDPDLIQNHHELNIRAHKLDPYRLTAMAVLPMCSIDAEYLTIPDVISYNHYFGWYGGDTSMNGEFFDNFHAKYPNRAIGLSEYGCEALNWHTSNPMQGDYTEEYQAYYHEELIKQIDERPFIWSTYVWNMFDFASDARAEGGEDGMNHKGLVTFDRKYKKDAFYAYQAWLSKEPMVHLCGKRYVDRVEDVTKVTVYSNLPEVSLYVNGELLETQKNDKPFFYFNVPNRGETEITVKAFNTDHSVVCEDKGDIRKVEVFNEEYRMKESGDILNWFETTAPKGYLSINDKFSDIMATPKGSLYIKFLVAKILVKAKLAAKKKYKSNGKAAQIDIKKMDIQKLIGSMPLKRILCMVGPAGLDVTFTKEDLLKINASLNKIKKKSE